MTEEKENRKSNSSLNTDAKKMLAKMMYDILKETNDTLGILSRIVFKLETRINDIKRAEVSSYSMKTWLK